MKRLLSVLALMLLVVAAGQLSAQTRRTIAEIKEVVSFTSDSSKFHGESVEVEGIVVTDPRDWYQAVESTVRYSFWIQAEGQGGPNSGLQIRLNDGSQAGGTGITSLRRGMRVRLKGVVSYFMGEIQINLSTNDEIEILGSGVPLAEKPVIPIGDLNIGDHVPGVSAQVETGTQWEGTYVTLRNVRVTRVTGTASRGSFHVSDNDGNEMLIWDAHKDMRARTGGFNFPAVGVVFTQISGIVYHRAFDKPGSYEVHPWSPEDLVADPTTVPPTMGNISRNPVCPTPAQSVQVSVPVTHNAGTAITRVSLKYGTVATGGTPMTVEMTRQGDNYVGTIPAQAAGTFVYYRVEAIDANGNSTRDIPVTAPFFYTVNENGCTIRDIQFANHSQYSNNDREINFPSGYRFHTVTNVRGIVTAVDQADNLGFVYIQQRGQSSWAGIQITGSGIAGLAIGDSVSVTGTVQESFGHTTINATEVNKLGTATPIAPIRVPLSTFATDAYVAAESRAKEQYEGMLIEIREATPLRVVQDKAEEQTFGGNVNTNRRMDWRVGTNRENELEGLRIMTGGTTGTDAASRSCGFINNPEWQARLTPGVDTFNIDRSGRFCFEYIRGIVFFGRSLWRLQPRNNADIRPDATCPLVDDTVSRAQLRVVNDFVKLAPNPTRDVVRLTSSGLMQSVELLDLTGRTVVRFRDLMATQTQLDLTGVQGGTYIVRVIDRQGLVSNQRLILTP
jgi:hypothetical protein